ncbi:LOW QUALITY PROTEIN: uncharacterized protein LOC108138364 [Drosophila elegans]|uniref:LOW QUALITY PROTEIN: uncharacterized protein LOC108138364 n=1 Tax=Drosophila elegans TaxID=30023 RepID=UPI0007E6F9AE|nr:LOW QUALITY PROTEIN: uncharacterized protein LOC108138364 [Drosophila elegans]
MGQLLLMVKHRDLTFLIKLYRRTPIFRPLHLPGRNPTQIDDHISQDTVDFPACDKTFSSRTSQNTLLGGFERLDVLREDDLDKESTQQQGNFELALMAGVQLEVDSEKDGKFDDHEDWLGCNGYVQYEV